jgi:L-threonylcarbamoyladenylate synthase
MEIVSNPTHGQIKNAAKALKDGHLVAFPTETVYGLGADATNAKAVSRIYSVKGRPIDHPLIVHISSINQLDKWASDIPDYAISLAKEFWPGPMTLIVKRSELAKDFITGGQHNIGLRVPNQPIALSLIREFESLGGLGIAAPSANRFGAVSPTTAGAVEEELGSFLELEDLILDGGSSEVGVESSIIDCTMSKPSILRPGGVTLEMVEEFMKVKLHTKLSLNKTKTSGQSHNHYTPKARVILNLLSEPGEGFIALASIPTPKGSVRLSSPKNIAEFAQGMYEALRNGDRKNLSVIKVILPEGIGLVDAIKDRLSKSSWKGDTNQS